MSQERASSTPLPADIESSAAGNPLNGKPESDCFHAGFHTEATTESAAEAAERRKRELSERMSALAKRPRRAPRFSPMVSGQQSAHLRELIKAVLGVDRHPLQVNAREALQTELDAAGLTPAADLLEAAATMRWMWDTSRAVAANIRGGIANRNKRQLYRIAEQVDERLAAYLSLRKRLGLDPEINPESNTFMTAMAKACARGIEECNADARAMGYAHFGERLVDSRERMIRMRGELNDPATKQAEQDKLDAERMQAHERVSAEPAPAAMPPEIEILPAHIPTPPARDVTPSEPPQLEYARSHSVSRILAGDIPSPTYDEHEQFRQWYSQLGTPGT